MTLKVYLLVNFVIMGVNFILRIIRITRIKEPFKLCFIGDKNVSEFFIWLQMYQQVRNMYASLVWRWERRRVLLSFFFSVHHLHQKAYRSCWSPCSSNPKTEKHFLLNKLPRIQIWKILCKWCIDVLCLVKQDNYSVNKLWGTSEVKFPIYHFMSWIIPTKSLGFYR